MDGANVKTYRDEFGIGQASCARNSLSVSQREAEKLRDDLADGPEDAFWRPFWLDRLADVEAEIARAQAVLSMEGEAA